MSAENIIKSENNQSQSQSQSQQQQNVFRKEQSRLNTLVMMNLMKKQALAVSFSGVIKSGRFKDDNMLSIFYAYSQGSNWQVVGGQTSGLSYKSQSTQDKIVWNFPFGVTFQTKSIPQWPQLTVVVYGSDYFGRSIPRGYGNVHLPTSEGKQNRKIRLFRPIQPISLFWNCLYFMTSSILQIKEPQKFLTKDKNRKNLRVQYCGQVQIQVNTNLINLDRHGYK